MASETAYTLSITAYSGMNLFYIDSSHPTETAARAPRIAVPISSYIHQTRHHSSRDEDAKCGDRPPEKGQHTYWVERKCGRITICIYARVMCVLCMWFDALYGRNVTYRHQSRDSARSTVPRGQHNMMKWKQYMPMAVGIMEFLSFYTSTSI